MRLERLATVTLGIYLLGTGCQRLAAGQWTYLDYLELPVLAPLAVLTGLALLAVGLFRWEWIARSPSRPRDKLVVGALRRPDASSPSRSASPPSAKTKARQDEG
jgi:hypothetical protein